MTDKQTIYNFLKPFVGKYVWSSEKGHGSFLTFNLGIPTIEINEPKIRTVFEKSEIKFPKDTYESRDIFLVGEMFIWVYCCNWRILVDEKLIAHNESSDKEINNAVDFLNGQIINEIEIDFEKLIINIQFDLKGQLIIWNNEYYEPDTDLILLRKHETWLTINNLREICLTDNNDNEILKEILTKRIKIKN